MTKEAAEILYNQSHRGTLRKPNCLLDSNLKSIDEMLNTLIGIIYFKNQDDMPLLKKISRITTCKHMLKSNEFVQELKGRGTVKKPYHLKTIFGEGEFLDMHNTYENGKIPTFIKKFYCFGNCLEYSMALAQHDIHSTVLTGIGYFKDAFLHSVLLAEHDGNPQIFDFNYDLVMDKDLYLKLFSFEVLSEISGQKLLDVADLVKAGPKVKDYQLLLAFDDCIKFKKEALAQQEQQKDATLTRQEQQKEENTPLHCPQEKSTSHKSINLAGNKQNATTNHNEREK